MKVWVRRSAVAIFVLASMSLEAGSAAGAVFGSKSHVQVAIATDDLGVGVNRFAFGIIYNDQPLSSGKPRLTFYYLSNGKVMREGSAVGSFSNIARDLKRSSQNSAAVSLKGVYVTHFHFKRAGNWGVTISLAYQRHNLVLRPAFVVRRRSLSPQVGSPAPRSHNPTTAQMPATLLDSGRPPDDMHTLSIAAALAQHRPLLVVFATPAFCESRLCGPEIQIVEGVEKQYKHLGVNFIHIEVYWKANPADGYAPTFTRWHLKSEPWIFVINKRGIIVAKFEGPTPASEIDPVLQLAMH